MQRGLLVNLLLLCLLVGDAAAHTRDWWQHYQKRAEGYQLKLQKGMRKLGEGLAADIASLNGLDFGQQCDCGTKCELKTRPLVEKLKKLEGRLDRCSTERRQHDRLERERDVLEAKLSTCEHKGASTAVLLKRQTAQLELLQAQECPVPQEPVCPAVDCPATDCPVVDCPACQVCSSCRSCPVPQEPACPSVDCPAVDCPVGGCPECQECSSCGSCPKSFDLLEVPCAPVPSGPAERSHRRLPWAKLFGALVLAFATRCWLKARCLAKRLKVLEPKLDAAQQKATSLESALAMEFPQDSHSASSDDFSCSIESDTVGGNKSARRIRVQCPGVAHGQVHVEGRPNGCLVTIQRPGLAPWARLFQFRPSEGCFEFQDDLAELELGILTLVLVASSAPCWVFRFPDHFDLAEADKEMAWMLSLSAGSGLPLDGPPEHGLEAPSTIGQPPFPLGGELEFEGERPDESADQLPAALGGAAAATEEQLRRQVLHGPLADHAVATEGEGPADGATAEVEPRGSLSDATAAATAVGPLAAEAFAVESGGEEDVPGAAAAAVAAPLAAEAFALDSGGEEDEPVSDDEGGSACSQAGSTSDEFVKVEHF